MRRRHLAALAAAVAVAAALSARPAVADPYESHWHTGYPPVPNGKAAIVRVFGQPCNGYANDDYVMWRARDNGVLYRVNFHRKLGLPHSSNLDYDIHNHLAYRNLDEELRSGIYGYNCRTIAGSSKWSTHAWGIAVDINSRYEHVGHDHCHTVTSAMARMWGEHGWRWGRSFEDCMHFQYATGY